MAVSRCCAVSESAPADPAPQLVQLAEAEAFRVIDDQGVRAGNVQAVFDDGRAQQHVVAAGIEVHHHVLQLVLPHLPVGNPDTRFGHQRPQALMELFNAPDPVVQEVDLPAAAEFPQDRVPDQRVGIFGHHRLHGNPFLRRRLQHAHVPDARHGHMQGPRNRGGG